MCASTDKHLRRNFALSVKNIKHKIGLLFIQLVNSNYFFSFLLETRFRSQVQCYSLKLFHYAFE